VTTSGGAAEDVLGVVDVGGSHVRAARVRWDAGRPVLGARAEADLDAAGARDELLDQIAAPLDRLGAPAWVVALPGPFDYVRGRGDFAGVGKFGALAGVDLRAALAGRLGLAPDGVHFLNDAVAYGLGEWWDATERASRTVCLTLGTGVGSVFLVDGDPVESGPGVPPHGWVHLLEIDGRPLEDTVSTRAIVGAYARGSGRRLAVRDVAAAAREGDVVATDVLGAAMHALAVALRPGLAAFGAEELVVGGGVARAWDLLEAPLRAGLAEGTTPVVTALRAAALLDDAPLLGAAWWFSRRGRAGSPAPRP
jgi:glucokinase